MELEDDLVVALTSLAATLTGFRADAIQRQAVVRAARRWTSLGHTREEVLALAAGRPPAVVEQREALYEALTQAVSVGETFFFRHPEHFRWLGGHLAERVAGGARSMRAWSAGCANGVEAYSLAATLRAVAPEASGIRVEVVGTDLVARCVTDARNATYTRWALRESGPMLFPVFERNVSGAAGEEHRVREDLRAITSFERHNLLEPPSFGLFDVIFCRNVFLYLTPPAIERVMEHLVNALAPGGVLVFGTLDVEHPPRGFVRVGPDALQIVQRAPARARTKPPPRDLRVERHAPRAKTVPPPQARPKTIRPKASEIAKARRSSVSALRAAPPAPRVDEPVALHLRALESIEKGDLGAATHILGGLYESFRSYVPGMLEWALVAERRREHALATELMEEVLRRASTLRGDELVVGPEPLPASFYVSRAREFLERRTGPRSHAADGRAHGKRRVP